MAELLRPGTAVSVTDPKHPAYRNFAVLDNIDRQTGEGWVRWRGGNDRLHWARVPLARLRRFGASRRRAQRRRRVGGQWR